ncbi:hypothetical protein JCM8547_005128 [Rhodosporidiobolus lusitaniae]
MRSVAILLSLAGLAAAQSGYGRFPCTIVNGDNSFSADQTQCASDLLVNPGSGAGDTGNQGDGATPVNPQCVQETESGAYFCGIAGATCATSDNCDNGQCVGGVCQGGFAQGCAGDDTLCSGYLYCLSGTFDVTPTNTCGAFGAFCQDPISVDPTFSDEQAQPIFNQFCSSGYCSRDTASCGIAPAVGNDCSADIFACGIPTGEVGSLFCDTSLAAPVCRVVTGPAPTGARARSRRDNVHRARSLCPASHSACKVQGGNGFECIDTTSNLEQCGACASSGGVDCTALAGVSSVGCVAGVCEIWACAEGFSWDAATQSCSA